MLNQLRFLHRASVFIHNNAKNYSKKVMPVRGMTDLYGTEIIKHNFIIDNSKQIAKAYGFQEISTPIVEHESTFSRTLGETSDVVNKEMYTFNDKSGNILTLRPENTASIMRAIISNPSLYINPVHQFFYYGPMFRYERPQKGRNRQFHQFGVESIGNDKVIDDLHTIELAVSILKRLNIWNKCTLEINTLGDSESRLAYRTELESYFSMKKSQLSKTSLDRLNRGSVLRILDSKEVQDIHLIEGAPLFSQYLNERSLKRFELLKSYLDELNIPYVVNEKLVRGLDYYNDTCFEIISNDLNSAVIAGGRYDKLSSQMGGKDMPGMGWAAGIERISLLLDINESEIIERPVYIIPLINEPNDPIEKESLILCSKLRSHGIKTIYGTKSLQKQLKIASSNNAQFSIIIGENELKNQKVLIKDMDNHIQFDCPFNEILNFIKNKR